MTNIKSIHIAAALMTNSSGHVLLVRKKGSSFFMQPGGKPEPGEQPESALIRELEEELNVIVDIASLIPMGQFIDSAINEPGHRLYADIFKIVNVSAEMTPTSEIEEIIWLDPTKPLNVKLAPLTKNQLLPLIQINEKHAQ